MSPDLFPIPESKPPLLATLRKAYDETVRELREAEAHDDETGEGVPIHLQILFATARHKLTAEEARLASIK